MAEPIHIACAADEKYVPHCAAMLHSALAQANPRPLHIHFMHEPQLPIQALDRLRALAARFGAPFDTLAFSDPRADTLPSTRTISRVAWFRSFLPELLPACERVLYLDCDVVVREPLQPLWDSAVDAHFVAAVRNVTEPRLADRPEALGIPRDQSYFNSGVLLMNLALMRRERCVEQVLDHAQRHREALIWVDQDSLNHVYGRRCLFVHPRWNCQNSMFVWPEARRVFGDEAIDEATRQPAVLHFEGPSFAKPWHYLNRHPFRAEYWRHLQASGFTARVEGRTLRNVVARHTDDLRRFGHAARQWLGR